MIYPKFLKQNDLVGITAPSHGCGSDIKETKISFNHLKENFKLIVTPDVYGDYLVSADKNTRVQEFNDLLWENIHLLMIYRGGNYIYELLNELDFDKIKEKRIWVMGYSDPTSILYILTTKYDLATIYGLNAKTFDSVVLEKYQGNALEIIKGNLLEQKTFVNTKTLSLNGDFTSSGVIIGGCLDVLRYLFGTSHDETKRFLAKYGDKKVIWYFDIFEMNSLDAYLTLLQMNNMNYFKYTDTIIFGSIMFPKIENNMTYIDVFKKVFKDKKIIVDANIGHVKPCFTIINGSYAKVKYQNNEMRLQMELMNENNG